jgi:hypothetical protein
MTIFNKQFFFGESLTKKTQFQPKYKLLLTPPFFKGGVGGGL